MLTMAGALGLIGGALLPWITFALSYETNPALGYEGIGRIPAAIGILLLLDALARKGRPGKRYSPFSALLAVFAVAIGFLKGVLILMGEPIEPGEIQTKPGIGQLLTIIAGIVVLIGGLEVDPELS